MILIIIIHIYVSFLWKRREANTQKLAINALKVKNIEQQKKTSNFKSVINFNFGVIAFEYGWLKVGIEYGWLKVGSLFKKKDFSLLL